MTYDEMEDRVLKPLEDALNEHDAPVELVQLVAAVIADRACDFNDVMGGGWTSEDWRRIDEAIRPAFDLREVKG